MKTQLLLPIRTQWRSGYRLAGLLLLGFLLLTLPQLTQAQIIRYVKPGATGNGTSWANASGDLQAMINVLLVDQVWVAAGTYKPTTGTDRTIGFVMKSGVAIYGGFVGTETSLSQRPTINPVAGQPSSSTLSGDIGIVGDNSDNSYHVISNAFSSGTTLTATAVLDGFVITGGNANGPANGANSQGGAMLNANSSPSLTNCSFQGNSANERGGAIFNQNSSPILTNCNLQNNSAALLGGAIFNEASDPMLTNCSLQNNTASVYGGAIFNQGSNPRLINCSFGSNSATLFGGAIGNQSSSPRLINCSFVGNVANQRGGAIANLLSSSPTLTNCSLLGNSAIELGGAIYNNGSSTRLTNSVVWGNGGANTIYNDNATLTANYSLFDADVTGYAGNSNLTTATSPFASTSSVVLNGCSPAINAGSNVGYTINASSNPANLADAPATDLAGNPRIVATTIDIGALEFQGTLSRSLAITQQPVSGSTVTVGASVTVPVSLSGTDGDTRYQWYKDGASVTGQTTTDLRLTNVTASQSGSYSLVATGSCNSVTTTAFSLQVLSPALVSGTKTVAGSFGAGEAITYTIVLTNTGQITQADNPGDELTDQLPAQLTLTSASASSGSVQTSGRTLTWNGSLASAQSVTITIGTTINANATAGQLISNQADITYDADGNGSNDGTARTDDPGVGGTEDPTRFTVVEYLPVRYVKPVASGRGDGSSWANASGDLQAMINAAGVGQVWVAAGTYKPTGTPDRTGTDRTVSFVMKSGVAIYGGFAGTETSLSQRPAVNPVAGQPSSTTLSGDIGTAGDNSDNTYQVVRNRQNGVDVTAVLDGFVITGGNANDPDFRGRQDRGGGMYNDGASPTVRNCLFQGNGSNGYGGAMANRENSAPQLTNCSFVGNSARSYGGAMSNQSGSNPRLTNCRFEANTADRGGAMINESGVATLLNCQFVGNQASTIGGAIDNIGDGLSLTDCQFLNNSADTEGGAIYTNSIRDVQLTNCSFVDNQVAGKGGAVSTARNLRLTNCQFVDNRATGANGQGGAVYVGINAGRDNGVQLTNCSFVGNRANTGGAIADDSRFEVQLVNSVLWDNGGANTLTIKQDEDKPNPVIAASYSLFDADVTGYSGTNNRTTTISPFVSTSSVALNPCSPAIDAGSNEAYTAAGGPATDLAGNPRIYPTGGIIDMGAVEFGGTGSTLSATPSQTNVTTNGGQDGRASVSVTGGSGAYTYDWSPGTPTGEGTGSISGLSAGTYSVVVTDAVGCSVTRSFTLTEPAPCTPSMSYLSDLAWVGTPVNGWGPVEKDRANGEQGASDGTTLKLNGTTYAKGLGVHSYSEITYNLGGSWSRFKAAIGIDDYVTSTGSVVMEVWADGFRLFQSGILRPDSPTVLVDVDVTGRQQLKLLVTNAGDRGAGDHADWADARLETACGTPPPAACVPLARQLSDLNWEGTPVNGWGPVEKNRANGEQGAGDGRTLMLNGQTYAKGLGVHATSEIVYNLGGSWDRFKAAIGVDDYITSERASVVFEVWADGQRLYQSPTLRATSATALVDVDVTGRQQLRLVVTGAGDGGDYDHADWADARLETACGTPTSFDTQAPSVPLNLASSNVTQTGLTLSWSASTDNMGVTGYEIFRGSDKIGESATTTFNVTGLTGGTLYSFTVRAKDAAGNVSAASSTLNVTTASAPVSGGCVATTSFLSDLSWEGTPINGYGPVERDRSNGDRAAGDGLTLKLNGTSYAKGLGVHAASEIVYNLGGSWNRFKAAIGVDDEVSSAAASVVFEVWADGQRLFQSPTLRATSAALPVEVDVTGRQQLRLVVTGAGDGIDSDHADWAEARLERACPPASTRLRVTASTVSTGAVVEERLPAPLRVYPNPASKQFTLELVDAYRGSLQVDVLDVHGRRVQAHQADKQQERFEQRVDVSTLPAGVYLLRVKAGEQLRTQRLVLQP